MKQAYPIVLTPDIEGGFIVFIPDFSINTQGETVAECIEMASDAIGGIGMVRENESLPLPSPSSMQEVVLESPEDFVTFVLVDFVAYRRKVDARTIRKNCSLPSWLNAEAEKAGINFSAVLQEGLKMKLNIAE